MIVQALTQMANFLVRALEGVLEFLKEVIPLFVKILFTTSPFSLLVYGLYSYKGIPFALLSGLGSVLFIGVGIIWAMRKQVRSRTLPPRVLAFVIILDLLVVASIPSLGAYWIEQYRMNSVFVVGKMSDVPDDLKSESRLTKQKVFLNLLTSSIGEDDISLTDYLHAMSELKEMDAYKMVPEATIIQALRICSDRVDMDTGFLGSKSYMRDQYRNACHVSIDFFVRTKAKDSCALLYKIQTKTGYLYEDAKKASRKICGQ